MLVTLALPEAFCVDDCAALYRGLHLAADEFGVLLGGGDIVRSPAFSITIALAGRTATSSLREPLVMTRDGARIGDVVAVSGSLGDSAAGLRLLRDSATFDGEGAQRLRQAHERPVPRVELARKAALAGIRCAIDVSDGLVQDLGHIADASGVGIRIDAARVPTSRELQDAFPGEALGLALAGGEDYELVLVGPMGIMDKLLPSNPLTLIGEAVHYDEPRVAVIDETGREIPHAARGWDHFTRQ